MTNMQGKNSDGKCPPTQLSALSERQRVLWNWTMQQLSPTLTAGREEEAFFIWTKCYAQLDRDKKMQLLCKLVPFHVWVGECKPGECKPQSSILFKDKAMKSVNLKSYKSSL